MKYDAIDRFLLAILTLSGLFLAALIGVGIYMMVDWVGLPIQIADGTIQNITFEKSHEEWRTHGKTHRLDLIPDTWHLKITIPLGSAISSDDFLITHQPYAWETIGNNIQVDYEISRLSDEFNVVNIHEKQ